VNKIIKSGMAYYKGIIVNAEEFRIPSYSISPFGTKFVSENAKILKLALNGKEELAQHYGDHCLCESGRDAIHLALKQYNLSQDDEIWIVTTSGKPYVSKCVTSTIEGFCRWSREYSENTKIIFLIHEFGYIYYNLAELKAYGLPIIEDLAYSALSISPQSLVGKSGDYSIISFPKIFPIQFGGALIINDKSHLDKIMSSSQDSVVEYLEVLVSHYLKNISFIKESRLKNVEYLGKLFNRIGFETRFRCGKWCVPGVYMFTGSYNYFSDLKQFMQRNGIECSVFYGEKTFFIPCHQYLSDEDLDYLYKMVNYYIENENCKY
jgi:DegT/DnrJ/EryC1/StrS aminotransferase family